MPILARLTLPAATVEKLRIPVTVEGVADPTALAVRTALSATAKDASSAAPAAWSAATWADADNVLTHLLTGSTAGDYGLWVEVTSGSEVIKRYSGPVRFV